MLTLTKRELQVLELVAEAKSNVAISEHLYIGTRTVEHHIAIIFKKLDLDRSRVNCRVAASNMYNHSKERLTTEGVLS